MVIATRQDSTRRLNQSHVSDYRRAVPVLHH
jgi:hypothetical protein